jgi:glycosyltransferase involved in cell wall biosynthesis
VNIAIISPSPKPFAMGGIEKLMMGMYTNIDELTDHKIELLKIPTQENNFWNLLDSYEAFYKFDASHFDMIITCKYPAWMVQHSNHIIYMAHHLRGLFDTYHLLGLPEKFQKTSSNKVTNKIISYLMAPENLLKDAGELFSLLHELREHYNDNNLDEIYSFPGSFIRQIIHYLDKWALHPSRISKYSAISNTVSKRKDYFPRGTHVEVIHPPSSLNGLRCGKYEHFLVVGRLDSPKRVEIVIQAMKMIKHPEAKLIIAGSGPEETKLKSLAAGDSRINFMGYVNNEVVKDLYADSLAVIYVPYDEDYGLATVEAMACGKPVITCSDSGGTTEFVRNGENGFLVESNPEDLSKAMNRILANPRVAIELGNNAQKTVEHINWPSTIQKLLRRPNEHYETNITKGFSTKKKLTILSTYPIYPRGHGGQLRVYNLYRHLTNEYDVTIVSFNNETNYITKEYGQIKEISIPKSTKHTEKEWEIEREIGIPITDIAMPRLSRLTPDYHVLAKEKMQQSDVIIASHPFLFHLVSEFVGNKKVIYDAHNIEYELKKSMLPQNKFSEKLLEELFEIERTACFESDYIMACSEEDKVKLSSIYHISLEKISVVPNGVDLESNQFVDYEKRQNNKENLGIAQEKIVIFIGSWHKPNLEAVEEILKIAPKLPDIKFIIMGGQGQAFIDRIHPRNVVFTGFVDEKMKQLIYSIADLAINPMITGSGTNLKVADYMANGVPVISTSIGARGYLVENDEQMIISDLKEFPTKILKLLRDGNMKNQLTLNARNFVKKKYSWKMISSEIKSKFH